MDRSYGGFIKHQGLTGRKNSVGTSLVMGSSHGSVRHHEPRDSDRIRQFFATAPVDQLFVRLKERIVKESGRDILEYLTLQGDRAKPRIEHASGPSLSTEEAGQVIGKSSETVRGYIRKNLLAAYTAANDPTKLRVPAWQFDSAEVYEWVPRLIEAFGDNGWPLLDFVTVERVSLGKRYLDLLREGEVEPVIAAARRANPD
jgi:hypothetical protein